jgi:3-dehydroquinate synthase
MGIVYSGAVIEITVNLGTRSYPIVVGAGAIGSVGERLRALRVGSRVALVSDPVVAPLYGPAVSDSLRDAGFGVTEVTVPAGEAAKTLGVAEHCWDAFLDAGLDRGSTVVALGGGTVGDVAGFAAATYMRGVNLVQIPTTLLAQVDASSGGKTAINHARAKNLIGAFHQPRLVIVDPAAIASLPERDFRSGLAEVAKHGIIADADYFADLEDHVPEILGRDLVTLERVVAGSCRIKASVVERDEQESDLRAVLNYGHTIGHALEAATGYRRWAHGEAVAIGIAGAARLAHRLGVAALETRDRQERLLDAFGLPVRVRDVDHTAVLAAIGHDKKAREGRVPFVLAPRIGEFRLVHDVPRDVVHSVLSDLARDGALEPQAR